MVGSGHSGGRTTRGERSRRDKRPTGDWPGRTVGRRVAAKSAKPPKRVSVLVSEKKLPQMHKLHKRLNGVASDGEVPNSLKTRDLVISVQNP